MRDEDSLSDGGRAVCDPRHYYSIYEANAIVPKLEFFFSRLARIQRRVNNLCRRASDLGFDVEKDEIPDDVDRIDNPLVKRIKRRLDELSEDYLYYLDKIDALGVVVEDADHGIIRMYSWLDDDEVFLSWQYGETEVSYWHDVHEDYIARRPIFDKRCKQAEGYPIH